MIDDMVIVDAVDRPWNIATANQNSAARAQIDAVYASRKLSPDRLRS